MIRPEKLIGLFEQALKEEWGYIWGTAGETWTAAKQAKLEKTTDAGRAQGRAYGSKWTGHRVADCSGLFSWAFRQLGGTMYHGSDTMFRKYCERKGELKKGKPAEGGTLKPGTAVFTWDGRKYSHVGLYTGNGKVIEAQSTLKGVTQGRVTVKKWTHWGEMKGVDYTFNSEFKIQNSELREDEAARPTLRRGSRGEAVKAMQAVLAGLGYDLGPCGADGDFGKCTEAAVKRFQRDRGLETDGIVGPKTWKAIGIAEGGLG